MKYRFLNLTLTIAICVIACNVSQPPTPSNNSPMKSKENSQNFKGFYVTHEFRKNTSIESFLKSQPKESFDALEITEASSYIIGIVHVFLNLANNSTFQPKFETKYHTKEGTIITKNWSGAQGNTSGKYRAVFTLPENVIEGETHILNN